MSAELAAGVIAEELGAAARGGRSPSGIPSRSRPRPSGRCTGPSPTTAGRSRSRCSTRASPRPSRPTWATWRCCAGCCASPRRPRTSDALVDELRDRVLEELDYRREADNQQLFAEYYDGHPTIRVPEDRRRAVHPPGGDQRAGRRGALRRAGPAGPSTSATWPRRPSTGSSSAACTTCTRSTATRTPATTCSTAAGASRSSTSAWSSTSPPRSCGRSWTWPATCASSSDPEAFRGSLEEPGSSRRARR